MTEQPGNGVSRLRLDLIYERARCVNGHHLTAEYDDNLKAVLIRHKQVGANGQILTLNRCLSPNDMTEVTEIGVLEESLARQIQRAHDQFEREMDLPIAMATHA